MILPFFCPTGRTLHNSGGYSTQCTLLVCSHARLPYSHTRIQYFEMALSDPGEKRTAGPEKGRSGGNPSDRAASQRERGEGTTLQVCTFSPGPDDFPIITGTQLEAAFSCPLLLCAHVDFKHRIDESGQCLTRGEHRFRTPPESGSDA